MLASEELEGRLTGSAGARRAADYIVNRLQEIGATPLLGSESLRQSFEFTAGMQDGGTTLKLVSADKTDVWSGEESIRALAFSETGTAHGELVFAGYGLTVPEAEGFAYDSYAGLDVEDKIVLVLRYFPEAAEASSRAMLARYAGLRFKALRARELGARAVLVVTGPRSPNAGETIPLTLDGAASDSGILAASVNGELGDALVAGFGAGRDLEELQAALEDGNPHVAGLVIEDVQITLSVEVDRQQRTGYNVIGYLPPRGKKIAHPGQKPYVVLGAHYDHLGHGAQGGSLARSDERGAVHVGADDNASGVAAVLAAGARLATSDRRRGVVLAFWSGEELGLLGSNGFVQQSALPLDEVCAYLNFDMVGRMEENRLTLQAVGSSSGWPAIIERANILIGFDLALQDDPYLPTDSTSFNQAGIPSLSFFTGSHPDYHRPTDRPEAINYEDLARVSEFGGLVAERLANLDAAPVFVAFQSQQPLGARDGLRAFTGTIPDYGTEVPGLLLAGVIDGGPAAEAGLAAGDVIVEFGGYQITNIYDYTYALDAVKIDEPVTIVFLREGERRQTMLIPRARQ